METKQLKFIIEAALLAAGKPLSVDRLQSLFEGRDAPARQDLRAALAELKSDYEERGIEIVEVASGFRAQVRESMGPHLEKLWEERPPRYSRALLETLAIIVYRQPVTRGEIEDIRGVAVSTNIVRTLLERNWIRVVGHRDVPGKPAMFGTTREFLDYFGLKKLDDLPPLSELKDFENLNIQLDLPGEDVDLDVVGDESDRVVESHGASRDFDQENSEPDISGDSDNVASLDAARTAAALDSRLEHELEEAEFDAESNSANVVPLKTP